MEAEQDAEVDVPVSKVDWDVVILVDAIALQRGYAAPGETCTIPGVGDVSVPWAKQVLGDAVFEVLVHNGTDITTYASSTRHRPRPVELAVTIRDRACIVAGCHHDRHTEYDHRDNYADTKRTDYQNLGLLCTRHHDEKTHRGARLERIDDHWIWHPPPRPEPTDNPDPNTPHDPNAFHLPSPLMSYDAPMRGASLSLNPNSMPNCARMAAA